MFYAFLLYNDYAPLLIRLILGIAFMVHGYPKLFKRENRQMLFGWLETIGFKPGKAWGLWLGTLEFFGGIALITGFYVQLVGFLLAIDMLVALWKVKWGKSAFTGQGGWELELTYCVMALSLVLSSAGAWSIDRYFFNF